MLVGVFAFAFHNGFIDPSYFEEIRVAKPLPSGGWLVATGGEMLIFIALGVLATDVFKIWKVKRKNHENRKVIGGVLSFVVFAVSVYLFFTSPNVSSSTFLILLGMCLLDMVLWFNVFTRAK